MLHQFPFADFKKASAEDKLGLFNSLLRSYQEEVDNLTKRAKFGENAFLNIYQKLYEAPDPYPALASMAVCVSFFYFFFFFFFLLLLLLLCYTILFLLDWYYMFWQQKTHADDNFIGLVVLLCNIEK